MGLLNFFQNGLGFKILCGTTKKMKMKMKNKNLLQNNKYICSTTPQNIWSKIIYTFCVCVYIYICVCVCVF